MYDEPLVTDRALLSLLARHDAQDKQPYIQRYFLIRVGMRPRMRARALFLSRKRPSHGGTFPGRKSQDSRSECRLSPNCPNETLGQEVVSAVADTVLAHPIHPYNSHRLTRANHQ